MQRLSFQQDYEFSVAYLSKKIIPSKPFSITLEETIKEKIQNQDNLSFAEDFQTRLYLQEVILCLNQRHPSKEELYNLTFNYNFVIWDILSIFKRKTVYLPLIFNW